MEVQPPKIEFVSQKMDLTSKNVIKSLLAKHDIRPTKRLGQNFLISKTVLQKFVEAADISEHDTVVEVGPGIGTITLELAKRAKKVIAVEKDPHLAKILRSTLANQNVRGPTSNILVITEDIRKFDPKDYTLTPSGYTLIGNLPFYLTNFLIRKFLESGTPPKDMTLIVQKEVAARICACPPRMNLLAVSVKFYGEPKLVSRIPKSSFWPQPEVDGAILRIATRSTTNINTKYHENFFKVVRAGFAHPRKLLASNLAKTLNIEKDKVKAYLLEMGLDKNARAENLSIENWKNLYQLLSRYDILS